jgi:hypothetical protein
VGRAGRIAAGVVGAIVLVLVLAQVFLPQIAADEVRGRLHKYGRVQSVSVSAWPAVKLLWENADSVTVKASDVKLSASQAAKLVWEARGASSLRATVARAQLGRLRLSDISLRKRGNALSALASISEADVKAALPVGVSLQLLGSERGVVRVRASGGLFGAGASVEALAGAREGKLVARPLGFLLEGVQLTLFADRHVYVEGVSASALTDAAGRLSYRLSMTARLR